MKNPKYPYDNTIKVGDLVKLMYGGDKGFWKVTKVTCRRHMGSNPLLEIERVFDNYGRNAARMVNDYDAFYIRKVTQATIDAINTSGAKMFEDMKVTLTNYLMNTVKK